MDKIYGLLKKYGLFGSQDKNLKIPHVVYKQKAFDCETVISHNFVVRYCDLVQGGFFITKNRDKDFYNFERRFFSKYFFREDTDLKWNFYLFIIVSESESMDSAICQIEQDDKYLRKLVMTEDEFEVYIGHLQNMKDGSAEVIRGMDTYAEWQRELSIAGLDGILTSSYKSDKVQNYIEKAIPIRSSGRPVQNWENRGRRNPKYLIKMLETINLQGFREHCLAERIEIPLANVNLFSGCNGVGKSSICSAVEYALTGEISDSPKEDGRIKVKIRNGEGFIEILDPLKTAKEKKGLDQLWYGTVTAAKNSSLNRNFHTFNYLGLEASGKYMQELDIKELVKNVLFGQEVTSAEVKMERYRIAFSDKRKEYSKRIKKISQEINKLQALYDINGFSMRDTGIADGFQKLGYKGKVMYEGQITKEVLLDYRKILFENYHHVEGLRLKCGKQETGTAILKKMEWLNKKRVIFQNLTNRRELLERNLEDMRKKIDNNNFRLERLYKKIADLQDLIQHGKGMENSFFCKQDFLSFKIEYEENSSLKNKLLKWLEQYQVNICSELNETELDKEIQLKLKEIENFQKEVTELSRHIEIQKRQNDNIDTITQEIFNLVEQYNKFHPHTKNCLVCGTAFASVEKMQKIISDQKQLAIMDDIRLQTLLKQKIEKETYLEEKRYVLKLLEEEKEKALQNRIALAEIKGIISMDKDQSGTEIRREVAVYIEQLQKNLEQNIKKYNYINKVIETGNLLVAYSGEDEWIVYLKKSLQSTIKYKEEVERSTEEHLEELYKLEQVNHEVMQEHIHFDEQEWEECQSKAYAFQALKQEWEIDNDLPIVKWIDRYYALKQEVQYTEEMYGKQETLKMQSAQLNKLEGEKKILESWIAVCKSACDIIEKQKRLGDVVDEFLIQNAKQIELFFKLLHRPKEFGKLSIMNGNICFIRNSNGQIAESSQMSTGQRMALAFSVMLTLHISASNAPNFLMLDEPVANLDDMHVLNLIDLLRELAIRGKQIIITTADSQMAQFLRRKFSFLKEGYSHFEMTRNGSEQTCIDLIHYSPDEKAAKDVRRLS